MQPTSAREAMVSAIRETQLRGFPLESITKEVLLEKNSLGETPLHCAAIYDCLDKIPAKFLTKETLLIRDKSGQSVFGYSAIHNNLNQLPQELITEEMLLSPCGRGRNQEFKVLNAIANLDQLNQISGIHLSQKCEKIVGKEWLAKNNALIQAKKQLAEAPAEHEVDIF